MNMKKTVFLIAAVLLSGFAPAQDLQRKLDSVKGVVKTGNDRQQFSALTTLSDYYSDNDLEQAMLYAKQSLAKAKAVRNDTFLSLGYNSVANVFQYKSQLDSALKYHKKALFVRQKVKDSTGIADSYNNIGIAYDQKAQYPEALQNYFRALAYYDDKSAVAKQAMTYTNIGIVYKTQKEYGKALQYYRKAYEAYQQTEDAFGKTVSAGNLGSILINFGKYDESIKYSEIAIEGYKKNNLDRYVAYPISNLAAVYDSLKQFGKAEKNYLEAIRLHEFYKNGYEVAENSNAYANFLIRQKKFSESIAVALTAIDYAKKSDAQLIIVNGYKNLSEANEMLGNFAEAYKYSNLYALGKDELFQAEKTKAVVEMESKYESEKKEKLLLQKDAEAKRKNYILAGVSLLAAFIICIAGLIFRQQKLKNKQQAQEHELKTAISKIETQNKLQEQRLDISRDLHDNIGAQLTFIISAVDNIKYAFDVQNAKLDNKLQSISNFTKSTIVELRDTIWAMNSQAIRFEDLRARILNFIEKAKEAKEEIEFGFTIDDDLNQMELDSVSGMNIYRTIQEAVNNAMKYSGAKQIAIEVKADGNQIRISIRDNGIGFDPKNTEAGNGLTNMEKRMGDIGWTYKLESETGKGTTITLLHKSNENHAS